MMKLKQLFTILSILISSTFSLTAATKAFDNETLRYVISYKWGVIHKDAADATLSLRRNGSNYNVMLTAKTKPWADKFYSVRDTLKGTIRMQDLKPLSYAKITHEKGKYALDEIHYSVSGLNTIGKIKKVRYKKGVEKVTNSQLSSTGPVYDMLSVFYYLRKLDYSQINKNKIYTATIFSGSKKETIKIKSLGLEKIKMKDKTEREAYHIKFNFTQAGGKKSSDDIDTWISTDDSHVPLYLVGKLPIGEVRATLI
ncbi:MAG: DUF3108 domain-containing protein [Muribaculaceae bacterium]|nr:DUF3108 domain-containing protein [Muribaculaceae bacterium]